MVIILIEIKFIGRNNCIETFKKESLDKEVGWLVGCFVLLYGISTLFRSFNAKLNFKQFSLV